MPLFEWLLKALIGLRGVFAVVSWSRYISYFRKISTMADFVLVSIFRTDRWCEIQILSQYFVLRQNQPFHVVSPNGTEYTTYFDEKIL